MQELLRAILGGALAVEDEPDGDELHRTITTTIAVYGSVTADGSRTSDVPSL